MGMATDIIVCHSVSSRMLEGDDISAYSVINSIYTNYIYYRYRFGIVFSWAEQCSLIVWHDYKLASPVERRV